MNKLNKLHPKIMSTAFSKWLKRLIIAGLCVALVGGAASAFLLQSQIQEGIQAAQTWSTQEREWRQDAETNGWGRWNRDAETDDWKSRWYGDFGSRAEEHFAISEPSTEAKIAVFATGALCGLLAVAVWILIALRLYQAAVQSNMMGAVHMFTSLYCFSERGILPYIAGLISLLAMIGAVCTFRMRMRKTNTKWLSYHRVLTVISVIACAAHPML